MPHKFSAKSKDKLTTVIPELQAVMRRALELSPIDFGISEGRRSIERQRELYDAGKSKTLKSRHIIGRAVDVYAWVDGTVSWNMDHYRVINEAVQKAAKELGASITWGGSWQTFKDGVHFQIED